jgi:hypothetical protein
VLRRIFELERDEVTGRWRKLHHEELHNSRWVEHVACMGEKRNAYTILVGKPERKRSLGTPRRRWQDNFKMVDDCNNPTRRPHCAINESYILLSTELTNYMEQSP